MKKGPPFDVEVVIRQQIIKSGERTRIPKRDPKMSMALFKTRYAF